MSALNNGLYVIRNRPTIEDSFHVEFSVYEGLRNKIIESLLTFYDSVEYKDADWLWFELLILCRYKEHNCMHGFNAVEWIGYLGDGSFNAHMEKAISWGKIRAGNGVGFGRGLRNIKVSYGQNVVFREGFTPQGINMRERMKKVPASPDKINFLPGSGK